MSSLVFESICSLGGLGKISRFPGTLGSIAAFIFSIVCFYFFNEAVYTGIFLLSTGIGAWAIYKVQKGSDRKDHSWIVIDEWIGMWLVGYLLFDIPATVTDKILILTGALVIFRLIDIFKCIPPIASIDRREEQAAHEIILDDVIAGVYTYAIVLLVLGFYTKEYVLAAVLFLIAPMVANMTPVLLRKVRILHWPISEKLFGKNKTWRGLVGGTLAGILIYFILIKLILLKFGLGIFPNLPYTLLIGFLLSFGALAGDLVKSFFKRRAGVPEGASWAPWDQVDYVLGAIVFTCFISGYNLKDVVLYLIVGGVLSVFAHRFSYMIKIIDTKS